MPRLIVTILSALLLCYAAPTAQHPADALIAAIEGPQTGREGDLVALTLADAMKKMGVPGLSVAVIKDFDIAWSRGYGLADVTSGASVTAGTLFQAASISKPVAAMAVLKAVLDGRFTLDQDVNELMTDVFKRPFPEMMRDMVLKPIGMTESAYEQPLSAERDRHAARAHDRGGAARDVKWHVYPELAAAGLWTTAPDLARFGIELQKSPQGKSNRVLTRAMAMEMAAPVGVGPFAIGMQVSRTGEGWYLQHGGSNWGFQCNLVVHKLKGYGFAAMTNADSGGRLIAELQQRIAAAYKWDTLDKPLPR